MNSDQKIQFIEVRSELGAGTRGAGMGIDALKVACLNKGEKFFAGHTPLIVNDRNFKLFEETDFPNARYTDAVFSNLQNVSNAVSDVLLQKNTFPLVLAADHSSAYGSIAGVKNRFPNKRLGVIWIDAHSDIHTPYTTPSGNMHGMPLAMAMAEDNKVCAVNEPDDEAIRYWEAIKQIGYDRAKVLPEDIAFVGVRSQEEPELELMKRHNIRNFTTEEVRKKGVYAIAEELFTYLNKCDIIYISFDVDSMDPSISVGTGTPVPGGLTSEEAEMLNTLLVKNEKVVCWEMAEINPTLDSLNVMAEQGYRVLKSVYHALLKR